VSGGFDCAVLWNVARSGFGRACSVFTAAAVFFIDGCNFGGAVASVPCVAVRFLLVRVD
jgi:hypothetical protein